LIVSTVAPPQPSLADFTRSLKSNPSPDNRQDQDSRFLGLCPAQITPHRIASLQHFAFPYQMAS
jgi:hypothetical protein